jgi:hypothetical protein
VWLLIRLGPLKRSQVLRIGKNRKDALRASQELAGPPVLQAQECKGFNSFERLCFEKRAMGCSAHTARKSKADAAVVLGSLATMMSSSPYLTIQSLQQCSKGAYLLLEQETDFI